MSMKKKILIEGLTNVASLRMGRGSIRGIGQDAGRFVVTTMGIPWQLTENLLGKTAQKVIMIESMEETWLEQQLKDLPPCDTLIGIGGGQAVDAAKYISWKKGLRLITIPTILSVDAFVTPAAGIRRDHEVIYVGESTPDPLVVDFEVIRTAPPELNIAGIGDLLSMHTATFDWELANRKGKSEYPFSSADVYKARSILTDLYQILPKIQENTDQGLQAIVEGYMRLNTICLPAGHYRVEEGSEHYLFYEIEERLKRPFIHGYIVGLGIYLMSWLQGNDPDGITRVMNDVGLRYHPADMEIRKADLTASLLNLRNFVEHRPNLWYTAINDSNISREWAEEAVRDLRFKMGD
jgi:glycerol-1-phosphate dehydrogenase [NAD(P)+]